MIKPAAAIPRRVTGQTGRAIVRVAAYPVVLVVRLRIRMATDTGKLRVIGRVGMTIGAGIPLILVFTAVNGKILGVVVKSGRRPGCFRVTSGAIG